MQPIPTIIRVFQLLFTIVVTGLMGTLIKNTYHLIDPFTGDELPPGSVLATQNFIMFVAVLSWIVSLYGLTSQFVEAIAIYIVLLALDVAGTVFSLIGAIVISVKLHVVDCHKIVEEGRRAYPWLDDSWIGAYGYELQASSVEARCREFQASDVFLYLIFATSAASLFFTLTTFRKGGPSTASYA